MTDAVNPKHSAKRLLLSSTEESQSTKHLRFQFFKMLIFFYSAAKYRSHIFFLPQETWFIKALNAPCLTPLTASNTLSV